MIPEFSISVTFQSKPTLKEACNLKAIIVTVSLALDYVLSGSSFDFFFLSFLNQESELGEC